MLSLSRIFSALLVVLIVSPFSAPFSTCGMATLVRPGRGQFSQPNAMAMDLRVARDIGNSALVPMRTSMRTNIAKMQLRPLPLGRREAPAALGSAETGVNLAGRHISSPLRI